MSLRSAAAALLAVQAALALPALGVCQQEIPIDVQGSRVRVPVSVNGSEPLDIVLDTGMGIRGVYLFRREFLELVGTSPRAQVQVPGAGVGEASTALLVDAQTLSVGPVVLDSQTVIIAQGERTQDWSFDGVIGRSLLVDHTVEVDYDASVMRLHDRDWRPDDSGWTPIPVRIERGLPWFEAEVDVEEGVTQTTEVYVDLAAGSTLELLVGSGRPFSPPEGAEETGLGMGLSGEIRGWRGQVHLLRVGGYDLRDVPAEWTPAEVRSKGGNAGAILGNGFMRHFSVVFQYAEGALYIKPNRRYLERASQGGRFHLTF